MIIAGIQETTLIDYPDKVACIIFTAGCNFRCRFCHNPELVLPSMIKENTNIPEEVFFNFLQSRKDVLDGVVISGGEPTLQRDLLVFCKKLKEKGFLVKLDTNGRDPSLVKKLIEQGLIDYVAMDIKIDQAQWTELLQSKEPMDAYKKTIKFLINSGIDYEFRTTMIKPYHTMEAFTSMMKSISGAKKYFLQSYRPEKTLDKDFSGITYTQREMNEFKKVAEKYVENCWIRVG